MNLNEVTLAGNLTRDPEMKYTPKGTAIANIGIAVNREWTDSGGQKKEEVAFIDCECWGKSAETISQYLSKGSPIYVRGRLKLDTWDDKQSGQKRSKLKVVVENFQFIGGKKDGESRSRNEASNATQREQPKEAPEESDPPF